jgi:two-component system response regulator FixJ
MDGLALQQELRRRGVEAPIVVLTGIADISLAVQAMQAGALDVLEKPVRREQLQRVVALALDADRQGRERNAARESLQNRIATLTLREQEIMQSLVAGKNTKELSAALGIGTQTVLKHKASLLRKLQVRNELELVRLLTVQRLGNDPAPAAPPAPGRRL